MITGILDAFFFQVRILPDKSCRLTISFDNCNNILSDDSFTLIEKFCFKNINLKKTCLGMRKNEYKTR